LAASSAAFFVVVAVEHPTSAINEPVATKRRN